MKLNMGPEMRYGKALFELSVEKKNAGVSEQVTGLFQSIDGSEELQSLLASGSASAEEKKKVLTQVLAEMKADDVFVNFVSLMCDKGRAEVLRAALSWFKVYEEAASGVVNAYVKTASKLSAAQKKEIESFVKDKAQGAKSVHLEEDVDTSLVAGMRVRIGSVEYDMSVRGRLDDLRTSLN